MKKLALILLVAFAACGKEHIEPLGHEFEIDVRLQSDSSGYYHLQLSQSWQTLHRISGQVSPVKNSYDLTKIYWESSHYWYIGDTLGYIIHYNDPLNDIYLYNSPDTAYIIWFDGFEVPTVNSASYSTEDGEINTMFGPVRNMRGDTITITAEAEFGDGYRSEKKKIKIILE